MTTLLNNIKVFHDVAVSAETDLAAGFGCSAYPVTSRCDDGLIACAYRAGSAQHSSDGLGVVQTSTDNGLNWSPVTVVFDGRNFNPPESLVSPQIIAPHDNSLLTLFPVTAITHPDHDILDTEEGLAQRRHYYKSRSVDGGQSWTEPERLTNISRTKIGLSGRSFVLPGGELFINTPHLNERGQGVVGACFSDDHGRTLSPVVPLFSDPSGEVNYDEAYYTVFDDDQILALYWVWKRDMKNLKVMRISETLPVHRSVSNDQGRTWTLPQPTGIIGQLTCPLAIDSKTVIAASNYRQKHPGIRLWISHDRGVTFDTDHVVQLWDATRQQVVAEPVSSIGTGSSEDENHQMESFTFGLPDLNDLGDGTYLLTYYATVERSLHIRACRFTLG